MQDAYPAELQAFVDAMPVVSYTPYQLASRRRLRLDEFRIEEVARGPDAVLAAFEHREAFGHIRVVECMDCKIDGKKLRAALMALPQLEVLLAHNLGLTSVRGCWLVA